MISSLPGEAVQFRVSTWMVVILLWMFGVLGSCSGCHLQIITKVSFALSILQLMFLMEMKYLAAVNAQFVCLWLDVHGL